VTPAPAPPPASAAAKAAWLATWTRWAREIRADVADVRKHFDRDYGRESDFPGLEARLSPFLTCAYYRDRVPRPPHGLEDVADASAHLCRTLEAAFEIAQEVLAGDADRVPAFDRKLAVAEDEVATLFAASSA
jgi:hypothetical protein